MQVGGIISNGIICFFFVACYVEIYKTFSVLMTSFKKFFGFLWWVGRKINGQLSDLHICNSNYFPKLSFCHLNMFRIGKYIFACYLKLVFWNVLWIDIMSQLYIHKTNVIVHVRRYVKLLMALHRVVLLNM